MFWWPPTFWTVARVGARGRMQYFVCL